MRAIRSLRYEPTREAARRHLQIAGAKLSNDTEKATDASGRARRMMPLERTGAFTLACMPS
jgi:hypothetical protein